jgi:hypothetical protein
MVTQAFVGGSVHAQHLIVYMLGIIRGRTWEDNGLDTYGAPLCISSVFHPSIGRSNGSW